MGPIYIFIEKGHLIGEKKYILYEGVLNNPNVCITEMKELSDYIFVDFRDLDKANNYTTEDLEKLIIIDYRDQQHKISNLHCLKYFKRSVIDKKNMEVVKYNREIIPISYCLKQEVLEFKNLYEYSRHIDISIFFKPEQQDYPHKSRKKVASFIKDTFHDYNIHVDYCGKHGEAGRSSIQHDYYNKMFHSKIVVTCNPEHWEGDYRTWEALSTGALVFVDIMKTPLINPLINKKHVIFYDRNNLSELKKNILFYLKHPELATKIAQEGHSYALKYHKPSDRIDEILSHLQKTI
jgi:hypothetical protein